MASLHGVDASTDTPRYCYPSSISGSFEDDHGDAHVPSQASSSGISIISAANFSVALQKVLSPFDALQRILGPKLSTSDGEATVSLLPDILERVEVIDVCIWMLPIRLQHLQDTLNGPDGSVLNQLSQYATILPLFVGKLDNEKDCRHALLRHNSNLAGIDEAGRLSPLMTAHMASCSGDVTTSRLLNVLQAFDIRQSRSIAYTAWYAKFGKIGSRPPLYAESQRSRNGSNGSFERLRRKSSGVCSVASEFSHAAQIDTQEASSFTTSMIEGLSLPPTSQHSSDPEQPALPSIRRARNVLGVKDPRQDSKKLQATPLDPLHIPSLIRLMGLHLSAGLSAWRQRVAGLFARHSTFSRLPSSSPDNEQEVGSDVFAGSNPESLLDGSSSIAKRSVFGHCSRRYEPSRAENEPTWRDTRLYRCKGLIIAGVVLGVAMFFS